MQCDDVQKVLKDLSYVFPSIGMTDLKLCYNMETSRLHFMQDETHLPFPRNGFYVVDKDLKRYEFNTRAYSELVKTGEVQTSRLQDVLVVLSVANAHRALFERGVSTESIEYNRPIRMYELSIRLGGDESALKMLDAIGTRPERVVFCSTDDDLTQRVPMPLRMAAAEALAGLTLAATHQGRWKQAVGYAAAALFKHPSALPFVNCSRLMAAARRDFALVLHLTEMAILPFYLRTNNSELYAKEKGVWGSAMPSDLPRHLAFTAQSLQSRFAGRHGVVCAKFKDTAFVEKVCAVCQKGTQRGEKVWSCKGCGLVYYCGKDCQKAHWSKHKLVCARRA